MANITAALVKELREKTGAGMMDCKNALSETDGDIEAAIDWLRKKGLAKAAKKSGRVAADGLVGVAVEANFGVVVEVNSETDFVARNDDFQALVRGVLAVALDKGAGVDVEAVKGAHYPGGGTVADAIANAIATIGENITLRRAHGLHVHEGVIGHYVHGQIVDGLGRIGVLVALNSTGDARAARRARPADRDACRGRQPARAERRGRRPGDVAREKAVLADKNAGKPPQVLERSSNPASRPITKRSACSIRPMSTTTPRPSRRRSRRPKRPSARRSRSRLCALRARRGHRKTGRRRLSFRINRAASGRPFSRTALTTRDLPTRGQEASLSDPAREARNRCSTASSSSCRARR